MMSSKLTLVLSTLAVLATANPTPDEPASSCNTAPIQCCESVQPASSGVAAALLASVGVVVQDPTTPIGITCSPISDFGVGSGGTW
ncbi:hypothetical protein A0H81_06676 [Grifola frondosa]|uniref:Hydrophobin n=1 Tax=Grifola frondosa TaxID=5627 RepID=A0A1C7M846_GRIFR|nr:hypothetical protein A0H81_06676 [Grifola frondosa]